MIGSAVAITSRRGERFYAELAATAQGIKEAQALRYRVFGEEMGAKLKGSAGCDYDEFDDYCQHLLVRTALDHQVIGCTRLLSNENAARIGRFYSESEFEMTAITSLPGRLLEVGRTCIAPNYRFGAAIAVLWSGLAEFIQQQGFNYLFGCASFSLGEKDLQAAAIMNRLRRNAMTPEHLRVIPKIPLLTTQISDEILDAPLPTLLRTYIRLGAKICGEPYRDLDFGVGDVLILLNINELSPSYSRHFLARLEKN